MTRHWRAFLMGLVFILPGCGFLAPEGTVPQEPEPPREVPELEQPPDAFINGAPGRIVSFCWTGGCADGFVEDPAILPAVGEPFGLTLPQGADIAQVSAWRGEPGSLVSAEVGHADGVIDGLPVDAVMVSVFVYFDQGGDAAYYWAVIPPPDTPSPSE